jgi:hypothetical protein
MIDVRRGEEKRTALLFACWPAGLVWNLGLIYFVSVQVVGYLSFDNLEPIDPNKYSSSCCLPTYLLTCINLSQFHALAVTVRWTSQSQLYWHVALSPFLSPNHHASLTSKLHSLGLTLPSLRGFFLSSLAATRPRTLRPPSSHRWLLYVAASTTPRHDDSPFVPPLGRRRPPVRPLCFGERYRLYHRPSSFLPRAPHVTMDQWGHYPDSASSSRRYNNGNPPPNQPPTSRDYNGNTQAQPPAGFTYEQYQGGMGAHSQAMSASPLATPQMRDGNGDVAMQDAGDPYSGMKYAMRPHHQQHLSSSRAPHHPSQETSAAAQRYSPMETLSPSSPYGAPQQAHNPYASQGAPQRQSPTRPGNYSSSNSYYSNRPQNQQLPPITPYPSNNESYPHSATAQVNPVFGNDPKSPRRPAPQTPQGNPGRGPVPEFTKVRSIADLKPKVNAQPAFRRANPEGGFISVSTVQGVIKIRVLTSRTQPLQALTSHLPSTYRICNPSFKYESSRNPRRVLTKPSKGVKNDGFDNEDSDYILYVNDILGSEETGHKYVSRLKRWCLGDGEC